MKRCNTDYNFQVNASPISPDDIYNRNSTEIILPLLICQICHQILNFPVQCEKCNQCFCELCIKKYKNLCPYRCNRPNFKSNKFVNNVLSTLKFKCKYGCGKIIDYDDLGKHYDEDCDKVDFKKKYKDLKKIMEKQKNKNNDGYSDDDFDSAY